MEVNTSQMKKKNKKQPNCFSKGWGGEGGGGGGGGEGGRGKGRRCCSSVTPTLTNRIPIYLYRLVTTTESTVM